MQTRILPCHQQVALQRRNACAFTAVQPSRRCQLTVVRSGTPANFEKSMFGENLGARDPYPGEIESNFGEKVLGNYDTEHLIMPPSGIRRHLGLSARSCKERAASLTILDDKERELCRNQVQGWKVENNAEGKQCIKQEWKLKDAAAAELLAGMIKGLVTDEGHADSLVLEHSGDTLTAQLCTKSLGGLTENDFICASKINDFNLKDLLPKRKMRYWA